MSLQYIEKESIKIKVFIQSVFPTSIKSTYQLHNALLAKEKELFLD